LYRNVLMLTFIFPKSNAVKITGRVSRSLTPRRAPRPLLGTIFALTCLAFLPSALAQDFTLQAAAFAPYAVDPGGTATANLTLGTLNGFTGTVSLACTVAPVQTTATPTCTVSPATVTPSASATATVTTATPTGDSPPALYTITITGTGPSTTHTVQENLTVLAVTPAFTITVGTAVTPSSVHAGSGGTGIVDVNPINGYSGSVTLACTSITPLVTTPPLCTFNPPVVNVNGTQTSSSVTINTIGTTTTTSANAHSRHFYALWLAFPFLTMLGAGLSTRKSRARRVAAALMLFAIVAALLLMPACGNSSSTTTSSTGVTPNDTYSFTVTGVDANGISSSNTTTTSVPTVSLTVD
jgi:hypothetical protein